MGFGRQNDGTLHRPLLGTLLCGEAGELALQEDRVPEAGPAESRAVLPAEELDHTGI